MKRGNGARFRTDMDQLSLPKMKKGEKMKRA
jgi:hypothetical protein